MTTMEKNASCNSRKMAKCLRDRMRILGYTILFYSPVCVCRGKMRKRVWVNSGDIVLVSLRDFQDGKGDVVAKYTADEARSLKAYGELPENAKIHETDAFDEENTYEIEFWEGASDEEDEPEESKEFEIDDI
ncbi:putative eukaryotic initiation factor-1A [Cardiosporidium cionae]|uniref:Eukaryotic initiation factor-1A n=1 Tax=Cardiosporidium cionae TaxID=476202 RepID=A0ABQ7J7F6_9APIC|nr:putative eukaryotic initiation factor-1A [Cardiosporidium cionae]|eukprot:KAF8819923.1 putative eukaryotic initiation factor-1A [Cardiosporidium cionae]